MPDKTAEDMAKAMGYNIVDEDAEKNTDQKDDQETEDRQDTTDKGDSSEEDKDQSEDSAKKDDTNEDQDSSGDQKDDTSVSDQDEKKIIPGSDDEKPGTDQAIDFDKLLAERSKGKFNTLADIEKALEEAPQNAFANEQIAKLNEYVKDGGKFEDFVRTQSVNYNEMPTVDLVREHLMATEGLSREEADLMIEEDYGVAENATDRQKQVAQVRLKRASATAKEFLLQNQQKWATPPQAENKADQQAVEQKWQSDLNTAVTQIENLDISLNQTDKFSYKIEKDLQKNIADKFKRPGDFFKRYINTDGTENVKKFVEDMIKIEKFEEIVRSASANTKASGKKEVIDDIKNPDYQGKGRKSDIDKPLTIAQQAAKEFYKQ